MASIRLAENVNTRPRQQQLRIESATARLVRRNQQLIETREVLEQALQNQERPPRPLSREPRTPHHNYRLHRLLAQTDNPGRSNSTVTTSNTPLLRSIIEDMDYSRLQSAELEAIAF
jgi:hypothetical protein